MINYPNTLLNRWKKFILKHCLSNDSIDSFVHRLQNTEIDKSKLSNTTDLLNFCLALKNYREVKLPIDSISIPAEFDLNSYNNVAA